MTEIPNTLLYRHGNFFPEPRPITVTNTVIEYLKQQCDFDEETLEDIIKFPRQAGRSLYYAILLAMYEGGYCPTACELQLIIERVSMMNTWERQSEERRDKHRRAMYGD